MEEVLAASQLEWDAGQRDKKARHLDATRSGNPMVYLRDSAYICSDSFCIAMPHTSRFAEYSRIKGRDLLVSHDRVTY